MRKGAIKLAEGQRWLFPDGQWLEIVRMVNIPGRKNPAPYCRNKAGNEWIGGMHTTARILEAERAVLETKPEPQEFDGWTIEINRPVETYTSNSPEPDPKWRFTDKAGHEHSRDEHSWPTLKWVMDETYWCESCNDEHNEGHWACAICDEPIEPGLIPGPHIHCIAGLLSGFVLAPNGDSYNLRPEELDAYQEHGLDHTLAMVSKREPDQWTRHQWTRRK